MEELRIFFKSIGKIYNLNKNAIKLKDVNNHRYEIKIRISKFEKVKNNVRSVFPLKCSIYFLFNTESFNTRIKY